MRLAILSALADTFGYAGASAGERPAFRRFAGKSVLSHQIDCAAHFNCDRVICLTNGLSPDMSAARSYAERAGVRLEIVDSNLRLSCLVTANDDVIVIADGILPDCAALLSALSERPAVVAFPADPALALGFERLDAARAWSGALRMRGAGVAQLADMPADCDLGSSLLRIALQSGTRVVELGPTQLTDGSWQRRVERHTSVEAERRWIARQVQPVSFIAPGLAFAQRVALRWSQDANEERWRRAPHITAALMGALAFAAGLASWPTTGLGLLFVASFALAVAQVFDRLEALGAPARASSWAWPVAHLLRDIIFVGLLSLLIAAQPGWLRVFVPVALVGALWLGEVSPRSPMQPLYADRLVIIAVLLVAGAPGWTGPITAGVFMLALAQLLWAARADRAKLTAD